MIASVTVTSDKHEIIGEALESVKEWVDLFVFVDIGIELETMAIIKRICGNKAVFVNSDPDILDISVWRNLGLEVAKNFGADWAVMLDTDWRYSGKPNLDVEDRVISVMHSSRTYSRECIFRLPAEGEFRGRIHEEWSTPSTLVMPGMVFHEIPKTEEQVMKNAEEMIPLLLQQSREDITNTRWHFYRGLCHFTLGRYQECLEAMEDAMVSNCGDHQRAVQGFWAALCLDKLGRHVEAINECSMGMMSHPGMVELPWLCAVECLKLGEPEKAICWANCAISNGLFVGASISKSRLGFREPYAMWEGPYEVIRDAMAMQGRPDEELEQIDLTIEHVKQRRKESEALDAHNG